MQCEEILNCQTWKLGLFGRRSFSQIKSGGTSQPTHWPLPMRAAAKPGLEVEPVDEAGKAGARASATTMVVTNNISNRGILSTHLPRSSSTSHPQGSNSNHNSHPPGGSSSSSNIHSHSSGDRGISRRPSDPGPTGRDHLPVSSSTPGPAGRGHLPNSSTVAEDLTRGDDIIGKAISRTDTRFCVSGAVRRSISTRHGPHRHRGAVPGIIGRIALRRYVHGQRFPLPAPARDPEIECIGYPRCGAAVRRRHGSSTGVPDG